MSTPRRDFLGWLGASTVLAATGNPLHATPVRSSRVSPQPVNPAWDMTWVDRLTAAHRAIFDSPAVSEGDALFRAVLWRDQLKEVYGTAPSDVNAVIVIRHEAIPLAMNDAYWERYKIGKEVKLKDPKTKKWTTINPIRATAADTPAKWADYSLERFMAQGGTVLACNLAFGEVVYRIRTEDKLKTRDEALARAKEMLIPGIILQPSGIFAALRAQEAGCHYIMAS